MENEKLSIKSKFQRVCWPQNEKLANTNTDIMVRFFVIPNYLAAFYEGIDKDENTSDIIHVLLRLSDTQVDEFNKLLIFWWVWSADRLAGRPGYALNSREVCEGLKTIWGLDEVLQETYTRAFDNPPPPPYTVVNTLWNLVCEKLENKNLSMVFVMPHLHRAQVGALQMLDEMVDKMLQK